MSTRTVQAVVSRGEGVEDDVAVPLGSLAEQAADAVAITGGAISGINVVVPNATAISAAGTGQGDATAITFGASRVATVASGTGVILPTAVAGKSAIVFNRGANALLVYPATGAAINALSANAGLSVAAGKAAILVAFSTTQWDAVVSA